MFGRAGSEPKLLFQGLAGFYATVSDLWYPMIRAAAGGFLLYHGWGKLMSGVAPVAAAMTKNGIEPHLAFAYMAIFLETIGAVCIILGLFTRFFAAAIAIELAVIAFAVQIHQGFARMELFLLWGIVMFAISLRGGGPYSLDRKIGKEL
ncbi:MAG TPA: DoxX family protein [Pseudolabrys sp.]